MVSWSWLLLATRYRFTVLRVSWRGTGAAAMCLSFAESDDVLCALVERSRGLTLQEVNDKLVLGGFGDLGLGPGWRTKLRLTRGVLWQKGLTVSGRGLLLIGFFEHLGCAVLDGRVSTGGGPQGRACLLSGFWLTTSAV